MGTYNNQELIATTVHDPPYMIVSQGENGTMSCSGYLYDVWSIMAKALNIRFKMVPLLSGDYGTLHENGTWTGMVGDLVYGRADAAVTTLDMTRERTTVVDFLDVCPVSTVTYRFYVKTKQDKVPDVTKGLFRALLKPLHVHVWWTLLASLLVLATILWISHRQEGAEGKSSVAQRDRDWPSCLFACFKTVVDQGWVATPRSLPGRIITISCWILGIIITKCYTANLISYLTNVHVSPAITNLRQFSEQPGWKLSVSPGHSSLSQWKTSSDIYERELYRRAWSGDGFIPLNISSPESTSRSTQGQVMVYVSIDAITVSLGQEACSFVPVPYAPVRQADVFMAISRKRRGLKRDLNKILLKMSNAGLVQALRRRWFGRTDVVCEPTSGYRQLALGDVFAVLLLVPLASCLALIMLILECVLCKHGVTKRLKEWLQQ